MNNENIPQNVEEIATNIHELLDKVCHGEETKNQVDETAIQDCVQSDRFKVVTPNRIQQLQGLNEAERTHCQTD